MQVIHIGKCGGSTVINVLKKNKIACDEIHINEPKFNDKHKYLIVIRNPIDRIISAFNWRYKLVVIDKKQEKRFLDEKNTLTKYKCINTFAENILNFDVKKTYIHHIYENIDFYLSNFLTKCKKENIIGVVTQENLEYDIQQIFKIRVNNIHINKNNTKTDKFISDKGYDLLKQYLYKDYECIDKLFSMGCISQKQYDILSK